MTGTLTGSNNQYEIPMFDSSGLINPERGYINPRRPFGYREYCPICEKRAFDVSGYESGDVGIELKCPHCKKIVLVPIRYTKQ